MSTNNINYTTEYEKTRVLYMRSLKAYDDLMYKYKDSAKAIAHLSSELIAERRKIFDYKLAMKSFIRDLEINMRHNPEKYTIENAKYFAIKFKDLLDDKKEGNK